MVRRALLIVNPRSRHGHEEAQRARQMLISAGFDVIQPDASDPSRYSDLVRRHRSTIDLVVLGGGDGTVNLALDGIISHDLPLGVLPLGTANNLARNLGLPLELEEACAVIAAGTTRVVDVADVNGHYFLNVAGLGLSTEVNRRVPKELKRRFGVFAYIAYAFAIARRMRPFRAEIALDNEAPVQVRTLQITVCNGRFYGAGLSINGDASIDDCALDLCSTEVTSWWRGLACLPAILRGRPQDHGSLRSLRGRNITIRTKRPLRIDVDGELRDVTPAVIRLHPKRLAIFAQPTIEAKSLS